MSAMLTDPFSVPGVLFGVEGTFGAKLDVDALLGAGLIAIRPPNPRLLVYPW